MPRAPIAGVIQLALGCAGAGIGTLVIAWIATALLEPAKAAEIMAWALEASDWKMAPGQTPESTARGMLNREFLFMVGLLSYIPCWFGMRGLKMARTSFLSREWSDDGEVRVQFKGQPHVGSAVKGRFLLDRKARPGDKFEVRLSCIRGIVPESPVHTDLDIAFDQKREVIAVPGESRCSVPFEFEIPLTAPASSKGLSRLIVGHYEWDLELSWPKSKKDDVRSASFEVEVAGA